jgi:hypothetical protein
VLVTGGTAVSGAGSGTLTFAPINNHSGSYNVSSASGGIDEGFAIQNDVCVGPGLIDIYATITPPTNGYLIGAGSALYSNGGTTLRYNVANTPMFNIVNDSVRLEHLTLLQNPGVPAVTGNYGVFIAGAGSNIGGAVANWGSMEDMTARGFYYGVADVGSGGQWDILRMAVTNTVSSCFVGRGAQGWWTDISTQFCGTKQTTPGSKQDGGHGVYLGQCALFPGCGIGPWISGLQTFNAYGYGLYVENVGVQLSGAWSVLNDDRAGEIFVAPYSGNSIISDFILAEAGLPLAMYSTNTTAIGMEISPISGTVLQVSNGIIGASEGIGLQVDGVSASVELLLNTIQEFSSGVGAVAGNTYGLKVTGPTNNVAVRASSFQSPTLLTGALSPQLLGDSFLGGTASLPSLKITGTSTNVLLDQNQIFNSNAGTGFQCDAGSTLLSGENYLNSPTNNCSRSSIGAQNFPQFNLVMGGLLTPSGGIITPTAAMHHVAAGAITTITVPNWINLSTGGGCIYLIQIGRAHV